MAINWGSYNGHLRVGIDWSISPANPNAGDTSVSVTVSFYVGSDGWNFSGDSSTLHESMTGWSRDDGFTNNLSGGYMKVGQNTKSYSISSNSGNINASANLTGAYNGASPSKSVSISLPNRPSPSVQPPSGGEGMSISLVTDTTAHFEWNEPTDNGGAVVDQYQIQVADNKGMNSPVVNTTNSGGRLYNATGLTPNTKYYVRVRAHNSAGWGPWTSVDYAAAQFTTDGTTPTAPGTPNQIAHTQTSINLSWKNSDSRGGGNITYTCDCATDSGFTTIVDTYSGSLSSAAFTGLTVGTTYYFRVRATNSFGNSGYSTGTAATKPPSVYTDQGDYVTLVNNLAGAVADKLVHLGGFAFRGVIADVNLPSGTEVFIDPGTNVQPCSMPDSPTYNSGSGNAVYTIQYPGTYLIEFCAQIPNGINRSTNGRIYVNGNANPSSTSGGKCGIACAWAETTSAARGMRTLTIVRQLSVGDTIGFSVQQASGGSVTMTDGIGTDMSCWTRVTMIGF